MLVYKNMWTCLKSEAKSLKNTLWWLLHRARSLLFKTGSQILMILLGYRGRAHRNAHHLTYRIEPVHLLGIPTALQWTHLLFLTDPHIGGNIDTQVADISREIQSLLTGSLPEKTLILHGGDFVCEWGGAEETSKTTFFDNIPKLFQWLSFYSHFSVIGNHDQSHPDFDTFRQCLEEEYQVIFLEKPEDTRYILINGAKIALHGIHTLATYLHTYPKERRDILMDAIIDALNAPESDCNIVLLHNPDGLEFLLQRLHKTGKQLLHPTLFLAGHTHGAMLNIPILRQLSLLGCKTRFGRYKGWYWPERKYSDTGNWQLYVSTGMGNSIGCDYRIHADPEVVLFTL